MVDITPFEKFLGRVGTAGSAISAVQTVIGLFTPDPIDALSSQIDTRFDDVEAQLENLEDDIAELSGSVDEVLGTVTGLYFSDRQNAISTAFSDVKDVQDLLNRFDRGLVEGQDIITLSESALNDVMAEFNDIPALVPLELGAFMLETITAAVATRLQVALQVEDGSIGLDSIRDNLELAIDAIEQIKTGMEASIPEALSSSSQVRVTNFYQPEFGLNDMRNALVEAVGGSVTTYNALGFQSLGTYAGSTVTPSELLNFMNTEISRSDLGLWLRSGIGDKNTNMANVLRDTLIELGANPNFSMTSETWMDIATTSEMTQAEYSHPGLVVTRIDYPYTEYFVSLAYGGIETGLYQSLVLAPLSDQLPAIIEQAESRTAAKEIALLPWDELDTIIDGYRSFMDGAEITRGNGDDIIDGTAGNDVLTALGGEDLIKGYGDEDVIYAGKGKDTVFGGQGSDIIYGANGNDTIRGGTQADIIFGGNGKDKLFGQAGDDQLAGGGNDDILLGGRGKDILAGNAGNDKLNGGSQADILIGGSGNDELIGGAGNDQFVFNRKSGDDTITDFEAARDILVFDDLNANNVTHQIVEDSTLLTWGDNSVVLEGVELALEEINFDFI